MSNDSLPYAGILANSATSRHRTRAAFTLIEVTVAIAISGALMALMAGMLLMLLRADRGSREALAEDLMLARLSAQFRQDVKQAAQASLQAEEGKPARLELVGAEGRVSYWFDGRLLREETAGDEPVRREDYRGIALTGIQLDVDAQAALEVPRLVRMSLERTPLRPEGPVQVLELSAPLARYRAVPSAGKAGSR